MRLQSFAAGTGLLATTLLALFAGGCSAGGTYRSFDVNDGSGAVISADKRAIIVMKDVDVRNGDKTPLHRATLVCAEPQPDAIRAVAQELSGAIEAQVNAAAPAAGGTGANGSGSASLSTAAAEAVASLGARTPTVQLLRDTLYRTCEGVANGVLGTEHVQFIASRIDNVMLGLHAIDGLTGMHGGAAVAIGTLIGKNADAGGEKKPDSGKSEGAKPDEGKQPTGNQPLDVTVKIEPASATSGASETATIAAEVRKIVAISLLDRSCSPDDADCAADQRDFVKLAFGSEPAKPGVAEPVAGVDRAKPSPKSNSLARLNRD